MKPSDQRQTSVSAVVGVVGSGFVGHFVVEAKALERGECSPLMQKHSQVFAVSVEPRH